MSESIRVDVRPDRVAVLTLDQPGVRANVLTTSLWTALEQALAALDPGLAGLVVASGKPGAFIAGADLKYLATIPAPSDPGVRSLIGLGLRVLDRLANLPFPTCAAVDGPALGGGLEVALACDYRVAGSNPKVELGLPEVKLGLIPGWGGTQRLPRLVGASTAAEMLATGQSVTSERASQIGLVDARAESSQLIEVAAELLRTRRAKRSPSAFDPTLPVVPREPAAVREAIQCLVDGLNRPLADGLWLETEAFLRVAGSDESRRLIAEFFANRKRG